MSGGNQILASIDILTGRWKKIKKPLRGQRKEVGAKARERINGQFIQMRAEKMPTGFDSHVLGDIIRRGQNVEARPHMSLGINGQYILPRILAITCSPESERKRVGDGGGRRVRAYGRAVHGEGCRANECLVSNMRKNS